MTIELISVPFIAAAAWRLAVLLVVEAGPFDVADHLRRALKADGTEDQLAGWPLNGWQKLWSCTWCMTAWTTLAMAGLWQLADWPVMLLAIWGYATATDMLCRRE